jgi:hypothetical protein
MRDLSRQQILPRKKSQNPSEKESATSNNTTSRKSHLHGSIEQDFASAGRLSLARHVDLAAVASKIRKSTSGIQIDLSFHVSSRHVERLRVSPAQNRQALAALDQNRFARLNSNTVAAS